MERYRLRQELKAMSYEDYLRSPVWRLFRQEILKRDNYKCSHCEISTDLEIHHHHYETLTREEPRDVITLCSGCHEREEEWIKKNGRRWIPSLLHPNVVDYYLYREEVEKHGHIVNYDARRFLRSLVEKHH